MLDKIKEIAFNIRRAFEEIEKGEGMRLGGLCGYCKRASIQLYLEAHRRGLDVRLVATPGHVYNTYGDYIVDVTATQFGIASPVWVVRKEGNQISYWTPTKDNLTVEQLNNETFWFVGERQTKEDSQIVQKYMQEEELCQTM